ncbi:unnamed protein product [Brachionus calyciflorus]|uniref:Farnesoic acid O-methyl transferase domain-containing protein n=1 Tax=Brachionus calyciflorus TaxID=104777 RepID=A0A814ESG8_9BILA|nr:unnamed protein product [Brachionus calyciflorus]
MKIFLLNILILTYFCCCSGQVSGYFRVRNNGAYFAKFRVNFQIGDRFETYYSGDFAVGQSRTLELPIGSGYCEIHVENLVFIGVWRGVFSLGYGDPVTKCFNIWGTTLNPGWEEESCKLILPMFCNATCDSSNVVYIICCIKCMVFYIDETSKCLNVRISQHLNSIKRFIPYINTENEVAMHFRKLGHVIYNDFRVCVFKDNLVDSTFRKTMEMDLIFLFLNVFGFAILNSKIDGLNNLKKLCFL